AARVEVAREQLANLFRVARLGERREPDQVGEEDRDEAALGRRRCGGGRGGLAAGQGGTAFAAELRSGRVRRPALRAGERQGAAAFEAELSPLLILCS